MNNKRRDSLKNALRYLDYSLKIVECARDSEVDVMDNCPENLQNSDRFTAMEDAVDFLDDAVESMEIAKEKIQDAVSV